LSKGAIVRAHDYKGMEHMKAIFKDTVEWSPDPVTAAAGADAVALVTDWPQYTTLPFRKISATMNTPLIFDGRNCLNRDVMRENGFQYYPIGRPAIENALRLSDERRIQAEAMLTRGDLNWTAASLPPVQGAATQPSLQMKPPKEYLATAAESYQAVTNSYPEITHADIAARFGLAAIHEQRGEWDQAKQIYSKISADSSKLGAYKELADARLKAVDLLRHPVIMGKPATEPAMPAAMNEFPSTRPLPPTIAARGSSSTTGSTAAKPQATTAPASAAPTTAPARP